MTDREAGAMDDTTESTEPTERTGGSREETGGPRPDGESGSAEDPGLEARLRRLDRILARMESDDVELEEALRLFEEGVGHVRAAERILAETELRVEELLSHGTEAMDLDES